MKRLFPNIFSNFKGDFLGGITAGIIALPLALAFGVSSGLGAAAGLYGAIFVGLFASIFGGTKPQISGPTGPITVVLAAIAAQHHNNLKFIFATIILAGLFQIILGLSKVGGLIKFVPYPVISGFMSGIGVIIIILQLNPLLGIDVQGTPIKTLLHLTEIASSFHLQSFLLGLMTLTIVFFTPSKISQKIPSSLIALLSVTIFSILAGFQVKTIGAIPMGLPHITLPAISAEELITILPIAMTVAILGAIDSLLTSLVADSITKTNHNSDQELIGQGIGNLFAGLFGGVAGAGATMRTVVNVKSGGRTPLSGVIHSLFLVSILLGAAPLAAKVPMAVLAGILIKVGFDIIDYKFIKVINHAPKHDLLVMLLVLFLTIFVDLIFAVGAGIVLSCLLFASRVASQFNITINGVKECTAEEICDSIEKKSNYKIRTLNIDGIFFFGSASRMLISVDELLGTEYLIISCEKIPEMDISAVFALEDMILRMRDKGIKTFVVVSGKHVSHQLFRLGLFQLITKDHIFYDKNKAIRKAQKLLLT